MFYALLGALALLAGSGQPQTTNSTAGDSTKVAAACGGDLSHADFEKLLPAKKRSLLTCLTRESVKQVGLTLPKKLDEITTLESVTANGTETTFHEVADLLRKNIDPAKFEAFKQVVRAKDCGNKDMSWIIAQGGSYRYELLDRNRQLVGTFLIDHCP